jgi:hypothetical protein
MLHVGLKIIQHHFFYTATMQMRRSALLALFSLAVLATAKVIDRSGGVSAIDPGENGHGYYILNDGQCDLSSAPGSSSVPEDNVVAANVFKDSLSWLSIWL